MNQQNTPNHALVIRQATAADAPEILAITQEAFGQYSANLGLPVAALNEDEEAVRQDIQTKTVLVAVVNGAVVGSVRLSARHGWAYFSRFGVSENTRGDGVGQALIEQACQWAQQQGLKGLVLHTASTLRPLVRFYYLHGFYIDSTEKSRGYTRALLIRPLQEGATIDPEQWL